MTNAQRYYKDIIGKELWTIKDGRIIKCQEITCPECPFLRNRDNGAISCRINKSKWLVEEYHEEIH